MEAAARLFRERGYHNVSIDDVAAAVGLTGPALYRHFRNKHQILAHALTEQLRAVEAVTTRSLAMAAEPEDRVTFFLSELGELVLEREEALLWKRERRHLSGDERVEFREKLRAVLAMALTILRSAYPDRREADLELLSWSVLSVYSNVREYREKLDHGRAKELLEVMARAILACTLEAATGVADTHDPSPREPQGRRERILSTATRLFDANGYNGIGIEGIASEAEMALATVYQNFGGKSEILNAVLTRGAEGLHYVTRHRLGFAKDPEDALDTIVRTYIELALGPHGPLLRIVASDLIYLAGEQQQAIRKSEREYVDEWVATLREVLPNIPVVEARARVQSSIGLVADITPIAAMRSRPHIADELRILVSAVLRSGNL